MKILKITQQKFKKNYKILTFGEDYSVKLHSDLVSKCSLVEGMDLLQEKVEELKFDSDCMETAEFAFMFLKYRSMTEKEMKDRLKRKGFKTKVIDVVIEQLKGKNLINDTEFAKNYTGSKLKSEGIGRLKIEQDLVNKGIDKDLAENAAKYTEEELLEQLPNEDERCYMLLLKRRKQIRVKDKKTLQRRFFDYLTRRGFSVDTVEKAMHRYRREGNESDII